LLHWALALVAAVIVLHAVRILLSQDQYRSDVAEVSEPVPVPPTTSTSPPPAAPTEPKSYFTVGSSLGVVYAAQGIPTTTENDVWHYGKSTVYFSNGAVTGWTHDPANPLRVTLIPASASQEVGAIFTIGSTKSEVRAVQGSPLIETDTVWDFGLSKIYFRNGRVTGWDSSPMQRLKARK
jgi:hypothetical protein